jgi:hypothetical protein
VSTPNGRRMATTAGPRHGGGTAGRVRVRTGTLALCRRSLGGAGSRRPRPRIRPPPKKNSKTLIAPRTPELTD